jgi:hypothetical protein
MSEMFEHALEEFLAERERKHKDHAFKRLTFLKNNLETREIDKDYYVEESIDTIKHLHHEINSIEYIREMLKNREDEGLLEWHF